MKKLIALILSTSVLFIFSCKKQTANPTIVEQPRFADSTAFTIAGKTYIKTTNSLNSDFFNAGVNIKLDSVVKTQAYYSSDKDSLIFSGRYLFIEAPTATSDDPYIISFFFIKKYAKSQLNTQASLAVPANINDLYSVGQYSYATDFNRENTLNGVAIQIDRKSEVGGMLTSYSPLPLTQKTGVNRDAQVNSQFEIISFKKIDDIQSVIEARFSATLFDGKEMPKSLTNGHLRLTINTN